MNEMKYDEEKNNLILPKNIRQVGKPNEKVKIYVEDYVITYINQIARESQNQQKLAILLGRIGKKDDAGVAFINGAVEVKDVTITDDQVLFTSEIWSRIYEDIQKYFHQMEVVGWFLTRPGKSLGINEKITKIHVDNFPGVDKALFIIDPMDHDEAFYIYDFGRLIRQEGYYIYYERNEDMQNYLIDQRKGESNEMPLKAAGIDRKVTDITRRKQPERKKSFAGMNKYMQKASSFVITFVLLVALIIGFTRLNQKTQTVSNTGTNVETSGEDTTPVQVIEGNIQPIDETNAGESTPAEVLDNTPAESTAPAETDAVSQVQADGGQTPEETEAPADAAGTSNVYRQYVVEQGDTLIGISTKFYDSISYIEQIQSLNGIEDPDKIYSGMTILLP